MKLALGRRTRWLGQLAPYLEGGIMSVSHTAYKLVGRDYNLNVQRVTENTAARVGEVFI